MSSYLTFSVSYASCEVTSLKSDRDRHIILRKAPAIQFILKTAISFLTGLDSSDPDLSGGLVGFQARLVCAWIQVGLEHRSLN
jgi:hypothetical protein